MTILQILHGNLEELAYRVTDNFCYGCYKVVEDEYCPDCGSDDFMRHLEGIGVEYGTEWVIDHLIEQNCESVDEEQIFEELLDECWPEVIIGSCTFYPSDIMKELDPTAFHVGAQENIDSLVEDGQMYEANGEYYQTHEIEQMLEEIEND